MTYMPAEYIDDLLTLEGISIRDMEPVITVNDLGPALPLLPNIASPEFRRLLPNGQIIYAFIQLGPELVVSMESLMDVVIGLHNMEVVNDQWFDCFRLAFDKYCDTGRVDPRWEFAIPATVTSTEWEDVWREGYKVQFHILMECLYDEFIEPDEPSNGETFGPDIFDEMVEEIIVNSVNYSWSAGSA